MFFVCLQGVFSKNNRYLENDTLFFSFTGPQMEFFPKLGHTQGLSPIPGLDD